MYPPAGLTYAGSFAGVELVCDRRLMSVRPSELPAPLHETAAGRRVLLHAMHSVSDSLTFAVWEGRPPPPLAEPLVGQRRRRGHRRPVPLRGALLGARPARAVGPAVG
ncbi:DUF6928 family protein [Streptomyces lichenis]|uniref:DUF6928 family protein n=1 Tax=Streptomyces lichenis TaxID=2306967 RepID=UPI0035569F3A